MKLDVLVAKKVIRKEKKEKDVSSTFAVGNGVSGKRENYFPEKLPGRICRVS